VLKTQVFDQNNKESENGNKVLPPYLLIQYLWFTVVWGKNWKLKKYTVLTFQNAHQARTGCNMMKSSSPNTPSTWPIFLCLHTHASPQNLPPFCFYHSCRSHQLPRYCSVCVQKALIYQLNFIVFMFVTWISCYIQRSVSTTVGLGMYFSKIRGHTCPWE
jgi:hypothetical protein